MTITGGSSTGDGGGIRSFGTLTLTAVHLTGNTAGFNGGGIFNTIGAGSLTVINSTISNNTANNNASAAGGGISDYSDGTTLTITNSTISGNRVPNGDQFDGGGIYVRGSSAVITNSTITDNETAGSNSAGGVLIRFQPGTVSVRNSIIAGNCTRTTNALCANTTTPDVRGTDGGVFASQGYNLIGNVGGETVFIQTGDQTGNATAPLDPRLLPLADNGGTMPTHRLRGNSPALDKGDCGGCSSDQRGFSRPVDLPSIANVSDASDIGSFELQSSELVDSTPPVITPTVTGTLGNNGWYTSNVQVSWSVVDDETFISTQTGCAIQTVTTDTSGVTFTCSATSLGGSSTQSVTIKRDATAPTITFASQTTPNAAGWNNTNVAVQWNCSDALSGATTPNTTNIVSTEGANQSTTGTCTDNAGNTSTNTRSGINIDKTAPNTVFASQTPAPNAAGWNNTNVTVNWNCTDAVSGPVNSTVSQTLTTEGSNLSATGTCTDVAGNNSSNTRSGIKIDKTAPSITFN
ncbi:MAG: choice-of-anchor Q domain-containing protein, partial [Pyrinomonadaceae bacterium]